MNTLRCYQVGFSILGFKMHYVISSPKKAEKFLTAFRFFNSYVNFIDRSMKMNKNFNKNENLDMDEKAVASLDACLKKDKRKQIFYKVLFLAALLVIIMLFRFDQNINNVSHKIILILLPIVMVVSYFKVCRE